MTVMKFKSLLLLIIITLSAFALWACVHTTTPPVTTSGLDYADFDTITSFDQIFIQEEGTYLVYLYSSSCSNCLSIKETVLNFALTYPYHTIFFFNVYGYKDTNPEVQQYLEDVNLAKLLVPSLLVIVNNEFDTTQMNKYYYEGKTRITAFLDDLQKGGFIFE
jgi:thiol-disulfide isomerase/thioredoxin